MTNQAISDQLIYSALKEVWGFNEFRTHQKTTIESVLQGRDSLTVLPTGGGKSLCYQLPASVSNGTAIVVSPLISLMADQVNALNLLGIPAACLNSAMSGDEIRREKARLFNGELKLLYVSPERLMLDHFKEELRSVRISFFAIDEAHCISQWGHDFRPEYKQLNCLRRLFPGVSVHAFTATAPPRLQAEIVGELALQDAQVLVGSYHRPNLFYRALRRNRLNQQILGIIADFEKNDSGIVYCLTRRETERVADTLRDAGYKALAYHAGMDPEIRNRHQEMFSQEKVHIMVATVAFGMGIDQSNVRYVIHAGMPRTLSHYQQEAGRAGRDGLPAKCVLIHAAKDILFWKRIIEEEGSLVQERMNQLQDMIRYAGDIRCRHQALIGYFGQDFNAADCNNCDVCRGEIESIADSRTISRMIISAVLKTRQTFGGAYVSQVLTGSKDRKILRNGHERLSVYNLLSKHSQIQVHDWVDQLQSQGYLVRSGGNYPTVAVSERGYQLLRPDKYGLSEDDLPVFLVETRKTEKAKAGKSVPRGDYDLELFEVLRAKRMELASRKGVPAFLIFGDRSLQDMARRKPTNKKEFLEVFGVGTHKLEQFGQAMLAAIQEHLAAQQAGSPSA